MVFTPHQNKQRESMCRPPTGSIDIIVNSLKTKVRYIYSHKAITKASMAAQSAKMGTTVLPASILGQTFESVINVELQVVVSSMS